MIRTSNKHENKYSVQNAYIGHLVSIFLVVSEKKSNTSYSHPRAPDPREYDDRMMQWRQDDKNHMEPSEHQSINTSPVPISYPRPISAPSGAKSFPWWTPVPMRRLYPGRVRKEGGTHRYQIGWNRRRWQTALWLISQSRCGEGKVPLRGKYVQEGR